MWCICPDNMGPEGYLLLQQKVWMFFFILGDPRSLVACVCFFLVATISHVTCYSSGRCAVRCVITSCLPRKKTSRGAAELPSRVRQVSQGKGKQNTTSTQAVWSGVSGARMDHLQLGLDRDVRMEKGLPSQQSRQHACQD